MNKGILYIILAGLSFLIVNFFVKLFGTNLNLFGIGELQKIPAHELVLARSIVSFAISFYIIKKRKLTLLGNNRKWLMVRGISGMIALTIFFYTIHYLPLAIASTVQYLAPIFTVLIAMKLLNEKVLNAQWFFISIAFFGAVLIGLEDILIPKSNTDGISMFWLGLGIISAAFSGLAYNAIVKLKETDSPINIVIYFPMLSIPVMVIWCMFDFVLPQGIEWGFLLIIGIFTQIAQILMTKAFHNGATNVIAPFQYLGAIYAMIIGFFIFDERLKFINYIGIGLILLGVLGNTLYNRIIKIKGMRYREK